MGNGMLHTVACPPVIPRGAHIYITAAIVVMCMGCVVAAPLVDVIV